MNVLAALENGLFALGQVLRFPVFALLWLCVLVSVFMAGSCVVDAVARRRVTLGADGRVVGWTIPAGGPTTFTLADAPAEVILDALGTGDR